MFRICSYVILLFGFIATPIQAHALVSINEISWMGDNGSSYCEWFELYNSGNERVDLANWRISVNGVERMIEPTLDANLSIAPHGHYVIGRDVDRCSDYLTQISDLLVSFALTDSGFTLELRNDNGTLIDSVDESTLDWSSFKEQNSSRDSLQWTGSEWVLAANTPGASNYEPEKPEVEERPRDDIGILKIKAPSTIYRGIPAILKSVSSPADARDYKSHEWNFGDLETSSMSSPTHTYTHPGSYRVHLSVYEDGEEITASRDIIVHEPSLTLTHERNGITIQNTGKFAIPLNGMTVTGSRSFRIPENTTLLPGGTISVSSSRIGDTSHATLLAPSGEYIALLEEKLPQSDTLTTTLPAHQDSSNTTAVPQKSSATTKDRDVNESTSTASTTTVQKTRANTLQASAPTANGFPFITASFFLLICCVLIYALYTHRRTR